MKLGTVERLIQYPADRLLVEGSRNYRRPGDATGLVGRNGQYEFDAYWLDGHPNRRGGSVITVVGTTVMQYCAYIKGIPTEDWGLSNRPAVWNHVPEFSTVLAVCSNDTDITNGGPHPGPHSACSEANMPVVMASVVMYYFKCRRGDGFMVVVVLIVDVMTSVVVMVMTSVVTVTTSADMVMVSVMWGSMWGHRGTFCSSLRSLKSTFHCDCGTCFHTRHNRSVVLLIRKYPSTNIINSKERHISPLRGLNSNFLRTLHIWSRWS